MINYISPRNPSDREDLEQVKRSRLEWIKQSLLNAIKRLPNSRYNEYRIKSIEEIDRKLKR